MGRLYNAEINERRERFIKEIQNGEIGRDVLSNAAFPFEEDRQAIYFSRTRKNMKSDMAYATMHYGSYTDDLKLLKELKNGELSKHK